MKLSPQQVARVSEALHQYSTAKTERERVVVHKHLVEDIQTWVDQYVRIVK